MTSHFLLRTTLRAFLLVLLGASCIHGQTVKIQPNVFPIAGLQFWNGGDGGYDSISISHLLDGGINALYDGSVCMSLPSRLHGGMSGWTGFFELYDASLLPAPHRNLISNYGDGGHGKEDAFEFRYFVAGNESILHYDRVKHKFYPENDTYACDMTNVWDSISGERTNNHEWAVLRTDPILSGDFVLKNSPRISMSSSRTDYFHCSFIYRLDTSARIFTTAPLYAVEYTIHFHSGDSSLLYHTDTLSWNNYVRDSATINNESARIMTFPNTHHSNDLAGLTPQRYAVARTNIPLYYSQGTNTYQVDSITCQVKRLIASDIYIRGLRVRTDLAERVLAGDTTMMTALKNICIKQRDSMQRTPHVGGRTAWDDLQYLTAGLEPTHESFRVFARIDKICYNTIGKHVFPFISNNFTPCEWSYYRSIYEDETDTVPGPISVENLEISNGAWWDSYGNRGWSTDKFTPMPADVVDGIFRNRPDYLTQLCPVTGRIGGSQDLLDSTVMTYNIYLDRMQSHINRYSPLQAALAAYPKYATDNKFSTWFAHLQCMTEIAITHTSPDDFSPHHDSAFIPAPAALTDSIESRLLAGTDCNPGSHPPYFNEVFSGFNFSRLRLVYRPQTKEELRSQAWIALAYGAKGFVINTIHSDGGANNGTLAFASDSDRIDYDTSQTKTFVNVNLGTTDAPIVPLSFFDEFFIVKEHRAGSKWVEDSYDTIKRDLSTGNWPGSCDSLMRVLQASNSTLNPIFNQRIVDSFVRISPPPTLDVSDCGPGGSHRWAPRCPNGDTTAGWYGCTRRSLCSDFWNRIMSPYSCQWQGKPFALPTWYGYKEKYNGCVRIAQDVEPIAPTLHDLVWRDGFAYHTRFVRDSSGVSLSDADTVWNKFPVMEDTSPSPLAISQHVSPFRYRQHSYPQFDATNAYDTPDSSYFEFGRFTHPKDSGLYVIVTNRRTWPIRALDDTTLMSYDTTDPGHPWDYLGAADARQVNLKIRTSLFDKKYSIFYVRNMRTNEEFFVQKDSFFHVQLAPGEGTLLRIAPATGVTIGIATANLFNNARHLAPIEHADHLFSYIATYEDNGKIKVAYPVEVNDPDIHEKRQAGTPTDFTIDASGKAHNPSASFNYRDTSSIGIVYSVDQIGKHHDQTAIIFRHVAHNDSSNFGTYDTLALFQKTDTNYWCAPAITPATPGKFWVTWSRPTFGTIALVDTLGHLLAADTVSISGASSIAFLSPATHHAAPGSDSCHISMQVANTFRTDIYYFNVWLDPFIINKIDTTPAINISAALPGCRNLHPCTAVDGKGLVSVVWETEEQVIRMNTLGWHISYDANTKRCAILRNRWSDGAWKDFTRFMVSTTPVYAHVPYLWPVLSTTSKYVPAFVDTLWYDAKRISCNDVASGHVWIGHTGLQGPALNDTGWRTVAVSDFSIEPATAMRTRWHDNMPDAMTYRSPLLNKNGEHEMRITRYAFPEQPVAPVKRFVETVGISPPTACWSFSARSGIVEINSITGDIAKAPWVSLNREPVDTLSTPVVDAFGSTAVRTEIFHTLTGDTLNYTRAFRVGDYSAGDTAEGASYLSVTHSGYLEFKLILRHAGDNSIMAVLDTAILRQNGTFTQTASLSDSGFAKYLVPLADSFYVSLETTQGAFDTLLLTHTESYDDDVIDTYPASDTELSFKMAPHTTSASDAPIKTITMSIVPNPSEGAMRVRIESAAHVPLDVRLFDLLGRDIRLLYSKDDPTDKTEFVITNHDLPTGGYFVRAHSGNQVLTRRIELRR